MAYSGFSRRGVIPGFVHLRGVHPSPPVPAPRLLVGTRIRWLTDTGAYLTGTVQSAAVGGEHRVLDDAAQAHDLDICSLQYELLRLDKGSATPAWARDIEGYWLDELGDSDATRAVISTMIRAQADNTRGNYCGKTAEYVRVCEAAGRVPRPATRATILHWLQFIKEKGTVRSGSIQPYLSAVNKFHVDVGLERPAVGQFVTDFVAGWGRIQREEIDESGDLSDVRVFLPAGVVARAFALAQRGPVIGAQLYRASVFVVLNFCLFARGATGITLRTLHVLLAENELRIVLQEEKGKNHRADRRHVGIPRTAVKGLYDLVKDFSAYQDKLWSGDRPEMFWRFPTDSSRKLPSRLADDWLKLVLAHLDVEAPPDLCWSGHIMRGGAASAAAAISVRENKICFFGGWAEMSAALAKKYIDPTVVACPACYFFFGWLLPAPRL